MDESLPAYCLKRTRRSKHIRLKVIAGGEVIVTAPVNVDEKFIRQFIVDNLAWLKRQIVRLGSITKSRISKEDDKRYYLIYKSRAEKLAGEKLVYWNKSYNFKYNSVSIRNSRSRWGSCSSKKNISFNFKIVFLPQELLDYLVVHELCHLSEPNHGPAFWSLVSCCIPDYLKKRKDLKIFDRSFTFSE